MTANITQNVPDVELVNMTEANVGCLLTIQYLQLI